MTVLPNPLLRLIVANIVDVLAVKRAFFLNQIYYFLQLDNCKWTFIFVILLAFHLVSYWLCWDRNLLVVIAEQQTNFKFFHRLDVLLPFLFLLCFQFLIFLLNDFCFVPWFTWVRWTWTRIRIIWLNGIILIISRRSTIHIKAIFNNIKFLNLR